MIADCKSCSHKSDSSAQRYQNKKYGEVAQGNRVFTESQKQLKDQIAGRCTCCNTEGTFDKKHVRL